MAKDAGFSGAGWRWLPAIAAGLIVAVLISALFSRATAAGSAADEAARCSAACARRRKGNRSPCERRPGGRRELHDPTPLFLPRAGAAPKRTFLHRCPKGRSRGILRGSSLPRIVSDSASPRLPVSRPAEVLLTSPPRSNPLVGFGRTDATVPALGSRLAFISAADARTGTVVLTDSLPDAPGAPPEVRKGDWSPLELWRRWIPQGSSRRLC